ncbi:MAG: DUF5655 domain-containing protein [Bacteroidota bacterium]
MNYTELDHFSGKEPIVKEIYDKLLCEVQHFGPVKIEPHKTSIHLVNRFGFAGVYTRRNYINLEMQLPSRITSPRIIKVEQVSANRYHHTTRLFSPNVIDAELVDWLKRAYDLKSGSTEPALFLPVSIIFLK